MRRQFLNKIEEKMATVYKGKTRTEELGPWSGRE